MKRFNPSPTTRLDSGAALPLSDRKFRDILLNLPAELLSLIISYCRPEQALAITAGLTKSYFHEVVRGDIARQRITAGIQASRILHNKACAEVFTEREVKLSREMSAIFVSLGGETYLQELQEEKDVCLQPSEHCVPFFLDTHPVFIALQNDHLGIRNIAFGLGNDGMPKWLRDENRLSSIFIDRVTRGIKSIRIVSDVSELSF
jgi:hypothetical protein